MKCGRWEEIGDFGGLTRFEDEFPLIRKEREWELPHSSQKSGLEWATGLECSARLLQDLLGVVVLDFSLIAQDLVIGGLQKLFPAIA